MNCNKCGAKDCMNEIDEELICEECGAAYCLEYLGYYPDGEIGFSLDERIDEGFEDKKWIEKVNLMRSKR